MIRRIRQVLAALSAVLFIAFTILWVRSHFVGDVAERSRVEQDNHYYEARIVTLESGAGGFSLETVHNIQAGTFINGLGRDDGISYWYFDKQPEYPRKPFYLPESYTPVLGFAWSEQATFTENGEVSEGGHLLTGTWIVVPYWAIFILTSMLPLDATLSRIRRRRRIRNQIRGLCPACGYDLRGTPALCPECGHQPPKNLQQPAQNSL